LVRLALDWTSEGEQQLLVLSLRTPRPVALSQPDDKNPFGANLHKCVLTSGNGPRSDC
jgi:hypothetical protein